MRELKLLGILVYVLFLSISLIVVPMFLEITPIGAVVYFSHGIIVAIVGSNLITKLIDKEKGKI